MTSSKRDKLQAKVTFVVFRGEVLAFFRATRMDGERDWTPETTRVDCRGVRLQACYAHCGQHSEAATDILRSARRATPEEYLPLLREMDGIGYSVTPHQSGRLKLKGGPMQAESDSRTLSAVRRILGGTGLDLQAVTAPFRAIGNSIYDGDDFGSLVMTAEDVNGSRTAAEVAACVNAVMSLRKLLFPPVKQDSANTMEDKT